jgi:hypothetical protein
MQLLVRQTLAQLGLTALALMVVESQVWGRMALASDCLLLTAASS